MTATPGNQTEAEAEAMFGLDRRDQRGLRLTVVVWFALFLVTAPLLFFLGERKRTWSSIPQPEFTWATFLDGAYMQRLETWLREESPFTYQLRGIWAETLFQWGIFDPVHVVIGRDGFFFSRGIVNTSRPQLLARREKRTGILVALRDRAERAGVQILAVPVPDTVTIYPEHLPMPREFVDERAANYGIVLEELAAARIPALDLRTPFLSSKAHELLYLRCDSHWTDLGARAAVRLVAGRLREAPYADLLGPEVQLKTDEQTVLVPGDLLGQMGMRSNRALRRSISGPSRAIEALCDSALPSSMRELQVSGSVVYVGPAVPGSPGASYEELMLAGSIALCGDSYANRSFKWRLAPELQRLVDWSNVGENAVAWQTLDRGLAAVESGTSRAKVIVWEFAERKFSQDL